MPDRVDDFDAANTIADILKDLDAERRQQVLRWVAESFDIAISAGTGSAASLGVVAGTTPTATQPASDIRTFVEQKSPKSDVQFAAVAAYFYRFVAPSNAQLDAISANIL